VTSSAVSANLETVLGDRLVSMKQADHVAFGSKGDVVVFSVHVRVTPRKQTFLFGYEYTP